MPSYSITTTPTAVFPDGQNESVILYNQGPATIYVDNDSSVSSSVSLPLPPTGSLAWDAQRPLWVIGAGTATLNVTRNSGMPLSPQTDTDQLLDLGTATGVSPITVANYESSYFETASYATVDVIVQTTNPGSPTGTDGYIITLSWYTSDNTPIGSTRFRTTKVWKTDGAIQATSPVKGSKATVSVVGISNIGETITVRTVATTRVRPQGWRQITYATGLLVPVIRERTAVCDSVSGTIEETSSSFYVDGWDFTTCFLSGVASRVRINLRMSGSVTVAGTLRLRQVFGGSRIIEDMTIATGSNIDTTMDLALSPHDAIMLTVPTSPTGGTARLYMSWYD